MKRKNTDYIPLKTNFCLYFLIFCTCAFCGISPSVADENMTVITPDIVGMSVDDAVKSLKDAGFTNNPNIETDTPVTGQNPPAGAEVSAQEICTILATSDGGSGDGAASNPYLASSLYAITHFDSSQSDSTPYGPPKGVFTMDPASKPIVNAGPINIITLASTDKDYMWAVGSDRVSYVYVADGQLTEVARYEALADATGGKIQAVPKENFQAFAQDTAVGMNTTTMNATLTELFGDK